MSAWLAFLVYDLLGDLFFDALASRARRRPPRPTKPGLVAETEGGRLVAVVERRADGTTVRHEQRSA